MVLLSQVLPSECSFQNYLHTPPFLPATQGGFPHKHNALLLIGALFPEQENKGLNRNPLKGGLLHCQLTTFHWSDLKYFRLFQGKIGVLKTEVKWD